MKNHVQIGDEVDVVAPANLSGGDLVVIGALVGVATRSALSGERLAIRRRGVYVLKKASATVFAVGAAVEGVTNGNLAAHTSGTRVGVVLEAAGAGTTAVTVILGA